MHGKSVVHMLFLLMVEYYMSLCFFLCVRGGGEFGEYWHKNGKTDKKTNTFQDVTAAANYLINSGD